MLDALVLLVYCAHQRCGGRKYLVHEDEDGLFRGQLDPLPDHVDELAHRKILGAKNRKTWGTTKRVEIGRTDGTRYFFLSIVGISVLSAFSQMTYMARWGTSPVSIVVGGAQRETGTHRYTIWVLLSDALSFGLALLERVFILELGAHVGGCCELRSVCG